MSQEFFKYLLMNKYLIFTEKNYQWISIKI